MEDNRKAVHKIKQSESCYFKESRFSNCSKTNKSPTWCRWSVSYHFQKFISWRKNVFVCTFLILSFMFPNRLKITYQHLKRRNVKNSKKFSFNLHHKFKWHNKKASKTSILHQSSTKKTLEIALRSVKPR